MEGSQNLKKVGHVILSRPFWPNFAIFPLVPLAVYTRAKFEVSSFDHSRDMEGVPKFKK